MSVSCSEEVKKTLERRSSWSPTRIKVLQLEESMGKPAERFLNGPVESISSSLVLLNAGVLFFQLEFAGYEIGAVREGKDPEKGWLDAQSVLSSCDQIFNLFFLCELIVRAIIFRCGCVWNQNTKQVRWLNCFDCFVVICSCADLYVFSRLSAEKSSLAFVRIVRIVRLVRLSRALKMIRVMRAFTPLRILVATVAKSLAALFWSMVFLGLLVFIAAVFLCQSLQLFLAEDELQGRDVLWARYGTASASTWTMFEATFSGCWPSYIQEVVQVHRGYYLFFYFYVTGVIFAVTRIISALFLKDTLQAAASDADMRVHETMQQRKKYLQKLDELFVLLDTSGDGKLSFEEFQQAISLKEVQAFLTMLEVNVSEVHSLWQMLMDETGSISYEAFLEGILKLKGQARAFDVIQLLRNSEDLRLTCKRIEQLCLSKESS